MKKIHLSVIGLLLCLSGNTQQSNQNSGINANYGQFFQPWTDVCCTFYVNSSSGNDSNDGQTPGTAWQTISKVNSFFLQPGQTVGFVRGGVWREILVVPQSGTSGSPITFTAYGSGSQPVLNGSDVFASWTSSSGVYFSAYSTTPTQVFYNGNRLLQVGTQGALVTGTWFLDVSNHRVYVFDNPSGNIIEVGQRDFGVEINGESWVVVNNLKITKTNNHGVASFGGNNNVISNNVIDNSFNFGIEIWCATPSQSFGLIQGNTVSTSGASGIDISNNSTFWNIQNNIVHHNSLLPANNAYSAGINIVNSSVNNITIENNTVYSNGLGQLTNIGFGIHVDIQSVDNIIRYNNTNGNNDCNILVEISATNQIYGNLAYNSIQGCGIGLRGESARPASGNTIYNNTVYGNLAVQTWAGGILLYGDGGSGAFVNNLIKNNITYNNTSPDLNAFDGAENDGTKGSGNVYAYNDIGPLGSNFIKWGNSTFYSTLSAWQTASSQSNNISGDPLFTNASTGIFTLRLGSPAIGTGIFISGINTMNPPNIGSK